MKTSSRKRPSWLTCLAAIGVLMVVTPAAHSAAPRPPTVIPLSPYFGRLVTATVRVGAKDYRFLFDTGGGQTSISPSLAEASGCRPHGRQVGFRMSGELMDGPVCDDVELSIGGRTWRHGAVGVFDIAKLLPKEAPPIDGTLSLQTFSEEIVTIDLAGSAIVIETPTSLAVRTAAMRRVSMRLATGVDGAELVPYAEVRAPGGRLWLELDSGNLDTILLAPHAAAELGFAPPEGKRAAEVSFLLGGGERCRGSASVRPLIHDGALNADFFRTHVITMDLGRGRLWIGARASGP